MTCPRRGLNLGIEILYGNLCVLLGAFDCGEKRVLAYVLLISFIWLGLKLRMLSKFRMSICNTLKLKYSCGAKKRCVFLLDIVEALVLAKKFRPKNYPKC